MHKRALFCFPSLLPSFLRSLPLVSIRTSLSPSVPYVTVIRTPLPLFFAFRCWLSDFAREKREGSSPVRRFSRPFHHGLCCLTVSDLPALH
jgi:hypothetical protein